jgi:hypothetical protein
MFRHSDFEGKKFSQVCATPPPPKKKTFPGRDYKKNRIKKSSLRKKVRPPYLCMLILSHGFQIYFLECQSTVSVKCGEAADNSA